MDLLRTTRRGLNILPTCVPTNSPEPFSFAANQERTIVNIRMDHFPYSNQHGADTMMYASNRSRSESGSSESSRGSGSTSTGGSGKSRRRSHRPRGCRGGSNRRRNNGGEGKKKAPMSKPTNSVDFHTKGGTRGGKYSYNNKSGDFDFALQSHRTQYQQQGAYNNYSNGRNDYAHADFQHDYDSNNNSNTGFGNSGYQMDFPVLQSSSSELSKLSIENDDGMILPPMPETAFQDSKPIPSGPNPYALNLSVSTSSTFIPASMNYGACLSTLPRNTVLPSSHPSNTSVDANRGRSQGILQPVTHVRGNSLHNISVGELPLMGGKDVPFKAIPDKISTIGSSEQDDQHYRNERLEKQRQGMAGGSLFATSPRSFLMGVKTTQPTAPTVFSY